jgi:S-DNA-T family DNA segregation ATPase FtsK/SpoIIIE
VATTTKPTGRPPAKRTPARRAPGKAAPAPGRPRRTEDPVTLEGGPGLLSRLSDDVAGLLLCGAGGLWALAIWVDLTGPVGRALRLGAGDLLGVGRFVVPLVLVAAGVALLREGGRALAGRLALGSAIGLVAVGGLLHIGHSVGRGWVLADLRSAGGLAGLAVGAPLRAALSVWGAGMVLAVAAVAGMLVVAGTSVATAARMVGRTTGPVWRGANRVLRRAAAAARLRAGAGRNRRGGPGVFDQDAEADVDDPFDVEAGVATAALTVAPAAAETRAMARPTPAAAAKGREKVEVHVPTGPAAAATGEQLRIDLGPGAEPGAWKLPALTLLERGKAMAVDREAVKARGRTLETALAAHGVETRLVGMTVGPTVTRFELELGPGVKVARVTSLHKDIAYAMAAPDVRLLAPIPGRSAIGVEVPNQTRQIVHVGDILTSPEARQEQHPLTVALGQDIAGRPVTANLATMPHLLIAGATGAGKSSCINSLLTSLLVRATPDQVRLIMVDPKRVELGQYNGLPHLLTQVVANPKKAANALAWAVAEMERRYDLLAEVGVRDITGYNAAFDRGELRGDDGAYGGSGDVDGVAKYQRLPFILVVVDELADLMMVAARDVEESICRIAQMARAIGIHLVIATQRPSVDVITGVIKANIPARIAFAVSGLIDSRVILDQPGAEKLVGKGDMLLLGPASSVPVRVQGAWVSEPEVKAVVAHWRRQAVANASAVETVPDTEIVGRDGEGGTPGSATGSADDDDMLESAMELIVRSQLGSTSMLQRKLRVGFARAGRIMDLLEQRGVVGPSEGSKARAVLMTPDELDELIARRQGG